ncbi:MULTISPECIES: hypothetical protein [Pseudomonas]|nr:MULTISPECIES: hypothetical protein [Pseudomonas]BBP83389.1 hypothetical protein PHLH8_30310 [Pseudomonas sp. Pc102]
MNQLFAMLLGLFGAGDSQANEQPAVQPLPEPISVQQWQAAFDEALALPEVRYSSSDQVTIIKNERDGSVYLFTTRKHPAYPAMIERRLVEGDAPRYSSSGRYAGDGQAYAAWLEKYHQFDNRPYESMNVSQGTELSSAN